MHSKPNENCTWSIIRNKLFRIINRKQYIDSRASMCSNSILACSRLSVSTVTTIERADGRSSSLTESLERANSIQATRMQIAFGKLLAF